MEGFLFAQINFQVADLLRQAIESIAVAVEQIRVIFWGSQQTAAERRLYFPPFGQIFSKSPLHFLAKAHQRGQVACMDAAAAVGRHIQDQVGAPAHGVQVNSPELFRCFHLLVFFRMVKPARADTHVAFCRYPVRAVGRVSLGGTPSPGAVLRMAAITGAEVQAEFQSVVPGRRRKVRAARRLCRCATCFPGRYA